MYKEGHLAIHFSEDEEDWLWDHVIGFKSKLFFTICKNGLSDWKIDRNSFRRLDDLEIEKWG